MILLDGTRASPRALGRLELANWQGTHRENHPLVFRINLPNAWYRVTCTSVHPDNAPLPLVDQRSIKFRAHDVVFVGPPYGAPLKIEGNRLVEGTGLVEVTEGHLRIVMGDPAYGGWTWSYTGPWYRGWNSWFGKRGNQRYAESWYQKLTRIVDPGFHHLRFNSLEIERVSAPPTRSSLVFRDFFNRDDSPDVNAGVAEAYWWSEFPLHPDFPDHTRAELYKTSIKLTSPKQDPSVVGLLQQILSPAEGMIRYSTRVSLFTGEGSWIHSGVQEAGILLLVEPSRPDEFHATFVGVAFDSTRPETKGWLKYRVGDGKAGYRTNLEVPDTALPIKITEGEFEIIVVHDGVKNVLRQIRVNGVDVTDYFSLDDRVQRISSGLFGIRSAMQNTTSKGQLQQFYWYYRVEKEVYVVNVEEM
jgi:hypothetical protein